MSKAKDQGPAYFFWLVSGEVFFHPVGKPEEVQSVTLNCTIKTVVPAVNGESLNKANRGLMQVLSDRTAATGVQMQPVQVNLISVSGLGLMTDVEFFGEPAKADGKPEDYAPAKVH